MKNYAIKLVTIMLMSLVLAGCVGSNAVTKKLMQFNIEVVDNRYARGGVNFLLAPVYGLTVAADYIIFNSIEFWAGKNVIDGSPHIFDTKTKTMIEINDDLSPALQDAPLSYNRTLERGTMTMLDESIVEVKLVYSDGSSAVLHGIKAGDRVRYFMDGDLVADTTLQQLEAFAAAGNPVQTLAAVDAETKVL